MNPIIFLLLCLAFLGVTGVMGYAAYILFFRKTGAEDFLKQTFDTELYEEDSNERSNLT